MPLVNAPEKLTIEAAPGRRVEVLTAGPAGQLPLVFHSGTPAGLAAFQPMIDAAAARNLRFVQYARPGYGGSDPLPGRQVSHAAADVAAILDHLGARFFVTAGWSGGGPHALASAAMLPGRCRAAASIAGPAPYCADGLDWLADMAPANVAEFGAAAHGEEAITTLVAAQAGLLTQITADQVAESLGDLVTAVDRAALTGDYASFVAESFRAALATGIAGWRDDDLAFVRDWGFSMDGLGTDVPVSIWQGGQDAMVPMAHGRWLAARIPRALAHLLPGEGHLSIGLLGFGQILDELAGLAGAH